MYAAATIRPRQELAGMLLASVSVVSGRHPARTDMYEPEFTEFVEKVGQRLSSAFYASYGPDVGSEVTSDALAYAWENWPRIRAMDNPAGYLYRVGQSKARRYHRPKVLFPRGGNPHHSPEFEPGLAPALEALTEAQREAVILVYALEWTTEEAARLLGKSRATVRRHLERGLAHLRESLEVADG